MARTVRIRVAGGLYHDVCARGRSFEEIVAIVERLKGETWPDFRDRYGDWGRDVVLWAGRQYGGMTLKELGSATTGKRGGGDMQRLLPLQATSARQRRLRLVPGGMSDREPVTTKTVSELPLHVEGERGLGIRQLNAYPPDDGVQTRQR